MIIVTGAAGFIGSCLVSKLNAEGHKREVVVVDDFYQDHKDNNLGVSVVRDWIHRDIFLKWFEKTSLNVDLVYHLGARTDTVEQDEAIFQKLNIDYSKKIWNICTEKQIPLVYASSAATYGNGEYGYEDDHKKIKQLQPLNQYGWSKQIFDLWALKQKKQPPMWIGLKFFNVYGPNEYHKARMASVIFHAYNQIKESGAMKLFKSHKKGIKNGHQSRDFVYVKDVVNVCHYFMKNKNVASGLYNLGTGKARTFKDLVENTFKAMGLKPKISFIDTPEDIRENYQYFTQADISKLRKAGYTNKFTSLEDGIKDYVQMYLSDHRYY